MFSERTLANGLRVIVEKVPAVRSVAVGVWVDVGSRDEVDGTHGASHFLEHLLFKGTATRSAEEIARSLDAVGAGFNAFTSKETTVFHVRCLDDDLDLGLDVLADITQRPALRDDDVESERSVVLEEIAMGEDSPDELVHDLFEATLYPGHPLGRPVIGTRGSIATMRRDDIAGHFGRWYGADRIVLAVAGAVDVDTVVGAIEDRWGGLGPADAARALPAPEPAAADAVETRDTEQVHLVLGAPAFARDDERRWALSLLNHVFGGGASSRLFLEVREKRGLVYSVGSYRSLYAGAGYVAAYAGSSPDRAAATLDVMRAEWQRMASGVTAAELAAAKGNVRASIAMRQEDTGSRMSRIGSSLLSLGEVLGVDEVVARIDAVGIDEVNDLAADLFARPTALGVIGPDDAADLVPAVA